MGQKLLIRFLILAVSLTLVPTVAQAGVNRIVELKGEANIQRMGTTNYQRAFPGMTLTLGDTLFPNEGAVVTVHCSDGKIRNAQPGVESRLKAICPSAKSTDPRGQAPIFIDLLEGDFRAATLVVTENPLLSWSPVAGATRYRVKLMAGNEVIWQEAVEATIVRYQGEPLRPKFPYELVVEAVDGEDSSPYQLKLFRAENAELIQAKVKAIESASVNEEARALMLADYYQEVEKTRFLLAAAMPLETLVKAGNQTPVIHRLLGDIYLRLGRWQEAKESFQKTINLAESEQNREEMASAQVGLAIVAMSHNNLSQARQLLIEAQKIAQLSGDEQQADLIEGWLVKLESKLSRNVQPINKVDSLRTNIRKSKTISHF
jgi:DNA-binding ferritin-like protein